jgi:hypothetical protein
VPGVHELEIQRSATANRPAPPAVAAARFGSELFFDVPDT